MKSDDYWQQRKNSWNQLLDKIVEGRFIGNCNWVFKKIKKVTKYHEF